MKTFDSSDDAVNDFIAQLRSRGLVIAEKRKRKAHSGQGKFINMDEVVTTTREVYLIKCRLQGRWIPKDSSKVSEFGKELDERFKFIVRTFGNGDPSISGLNEDTILDLVDLETQGYTCYLVTIFPKSGEIFWCHAFEAYDLVMRYGALPQHSFQGLSGQTFCSIPTGWMKKWDEVIVAPPAVIAE